MKTKIYCAIPKCRRKERVNADYSYHHFPQRGKYKVSVTNSFGDVEKVDLHSQWEKVTNILNHGPNDQICSRHFKPSDYCKNGVRNRRRRLKHDAIPSLHLPTTNKKSVQSSTKAGKADLNVGEIFSNRRCNNEDSVSDKFSEYNQYNCEAKSDSNMNLQKNKDHNQPHPDDKLNIMESKTSELIDHSKMLSRYCRTCAELKIPLIDIFSDRGIQMRLNQMMKHLENINQHDSLSTQMCMDCICHLKMSYKFFMQIKTAEEELKSIHNQHNIIHDNNLTCSDKSDNTWKNSTELNVQESFPLENSIHSESTDAVSHNVIIKCDDDVDNNNDDDNVDNNNYDDDDLQSIEEFDPEDDDFESGDYENIKTESEIESIIKKDDDSETQLSNYKTNEMSYSNNVNEMDNSIMKSKIINETLYDNVKEINGDVKVKLENVIIDTCLESSSINSKGNITKGNSKQPNILKRKQSCHAEAGDFSSTNTDSIGREAKIPKLNTANISPSDEEGIMYVTIKGSKPNELLLVKIKKKDKSSEKKDDKRAKTLPLKDIFTDRLKKLKNQAIIEEQIKQYKKKRTQLLGRGNNRANITTKNIFNTTSSVPKADKSADGISHTISSSNLKKNLSIRNTILSKKQSANCVSEQKDNIEMKNNFQVKDENEIENFKESKVHNNEHEMFDEHNTFAWNPLRYHPVTIYKNGRNTNVVFKNKSALVVSIRGAANAHFLICENSDYRSSLCYWIIIGGWGNVRTGIRRCPDGVKDSWYPPEGSQCIILRSKLWHHPLNPHEWRTFIIAWNSVTKTIKLYDPNKMILEYTDYQYTNYNPEQYHVFFGNPEANLPTQFRFHEYNYTSTTEFEAFLISELLNININRDICIDMLVGLCAWCELHVKLMYNNGPQVIMNIISGAVASENVDHNLPMWQHARITATNLDESYKTVILEIVTKSNKRHGNHWALSNVQQCMTEGTVKTINMITIQDNLNGEYIWPNVTCQRLSYNQQHLEIPTATLENLTFENNIITWSLPNVNCSTITGPISATRLYFFGESEYVKDFTDFYDTEAFSFVLNKTKVQNIHGCERYRVRIHALREINGKHNESAFKELNFITNPQPPPKVINLTIVEVDYLNKTTLLRWKKPLPPTNGEIIKYNVIFIGYYNDKSEVITVYPHEICSLWENSICKTVPHPNQSRKIIQVSAVNKNVNESGDVSEIIDRTYETEPDPPDKVFILKLEHGVVDIKWEHPFKTGGPMNEFKIKYEEKSTRLIKNSHDDKTIMKIINFPIDRSNYQKFYSTKLYLLPSTQYEIHIQGVIKRAKSELIGNSSIRTIETTSSFSWLNKKPSFKINNESYSVTIFLPEIANNTRNNQVHIVVIGQLECPNLSLVDERLAGDLEIKDDEIAWHFGAFSTSRTSIVIGDSENNALNCTLHPGRIYIVAIVVQEDDIAELERTKPLIWRSKSIQVGPISREPHEIWAVPLFVILIVAVGLVYYFTRKRKST
ncbi:hypothetical protein PV327_006239 [Microctonus hyperodae]|uniref:THAP-type domain-containing protein n=1 Tax=Microctonus hyperodae TaxID=165561 RepID=A0AA39F3V8_MICHY|nr:hypothetical protein PV327_006239 [Microctonus hyperodae]